MSAAAALPAPRRFAVSWFKAAIDFENWIRSARRNWSWLKHPRRQRKTEHTPKDWEVARDIGETTGGKPPSRRTVQRGWEYLDLVLGAIERDWSGGHGRVIRIKLPLAGDDKEEKPAAKAKPARPRPAPPAAPPPGPSPGPAPRDPPAEGTAGDLAAAAAALRQQVAQAAAERRAEVAARKEANGPRVLIGVDQVELEARALTDEGLRRLEDLEARGELTSSERRVLDHVRRNRSP